MANNFKNAVLNDVGTTPVTLYTSTGVKSILIELDVANISNTGITIDVTLRDSSAGTTVNLIKGAPIPVGSTLQVVSGQKVVLEAGDFIQVSSSVAASADVIASILQDVQ